MKKEITQAELKTRISYDHESGIFTWINSKSNILSGTKAGSIMANGYLVIRLNKKLYYAHRLAWLYVYGCFPEEYIDHINRIRSDNRLCNLRTARKNENPKNVSIHKDNKSGFAGVIRRKDTNRFSAKICVNYKNINLGCFDTALEASNTYQKAKSELHTFNQSSGS